MTRKNRIVLFLVALVLGGAAGWKWLRRTEGSAANAPAAPREASLPAPSKDPIRAEFDAIAQKLFTTPGGWLDRTGSETLGRAIEAPGGDYGQKMGMRCDRVLALLKEAKPKQAVDEVEAIFRMLAEHPELLQREPKVHRLRALAYLRNAEVENCITRHNKECCV